MPKVYLSPSVQDYKEYITGTGSEEYYMNRIADGMVPWLRGWGIEFVRNDPGDTLSRIVDRSNRQHCDFHLALHSNTAPDNLAGAIQGPDVYYFSESAEGLRASGLFAAELKAIYPNPHLVAAIPNNTLQELKQTRAPACLVELAYHDNYEDARWIIDNMQAISKALAFSLARFWELPL